MSLEGFSKKGMELGGNLERISETKNDLNQQYINTIKRLAMQKMKNDILFEGTLGAAIRKFSSLGLDVSKESILKDIQEEIYRQNPSFGLSTDEISQRKLSSVDSNQKERESVNYQTKVEQLKNNLENIFGSSTTKEQRSVDISSTIPREPAIQSAREYEISINNYSQINEQSVQQAPLHTEKEIHEQLDQAQEEIKQKLEWAKQQPNEPTMTFTGNLTNLSDDVKKRIIQQMESRGEVIISEIDKVYQEGNYIVVDAKDNQGRFTGAEFTLDDFTKLVNQPSAITKIEEISQQPTDNIIEPLVQEQPRVENTQSKQETIQEQSQQISQDESEKTLQEQQAQMKNQIINQIMAGMNNAGEFSFGDISIGERMSIMQNAQNKLNAKSMDELQMLLSTYQKQNTQEETMSNGMHR